MLYCRSLVLLLQRFYGFPNSKTAAATWLAIINIIGSWLILKMIKVLNFEHIFGRKIVRISDIFGESLIGDIVDTDRIFL